MKNIRHRLAVIVFLVSLASALFPASTWAAAEPDRSIKRHTAGDTQRTALVIGNSAYSKNPLKNPKRDAAAMAEQLRQSGFETVLATDADKKAMAGAIKDFGAKLTKGGAGLFFFAGHGMQINGRNYLLPIDVSIESESDVEYEAIDAGRVLGKMEDAGNGLNIVILDACRDNPFARSFRSASAGSGLAKMDAPTGSFIAYATKPGSVAADGQGNHSPFTSALLGAMRQPGLSIEQLFKNVRNQVMRDTDNKQVPWEASSLRGDFHFAGAPGAAAIQQSSTPVAAPPAPRIDVEEKHWLAVEESSKIAELETYLKEYPKGRFATLANLKISRLRETTATPPAKTGDTYTDPTTGMEFVFVPGGCFQMGDTFGDGQDASQKPVHEVCVDSFYMGKYEVTQGEYAKITGSNPSNFKKGDRYPVEMVSWDDAQAFIKTLNSKSVKAFRLPTEAEWEYAARSGGKSEKYSGSNSPDGVAWYGENSGNATHQVGTKSPNGLGLYDMSGNVWEWCNDWYGKTYYESSPRQSPVGPSSGRSRVLRGGEWNLSIPQWVRAARRYGDSPNASQNSLGFRLLLQASAPGQ